MIRSRLVGGASCAALLASLGACSVAAAPSNEKESTGAVDQAAMVETDAIWDRDSHGIANISVCWLDSGWAAEKKIVREAFEDTWGRVANINFLWNECTKAPDHGFAILIRDSGGDDARPHTPTVGKSMDGETMFFNFTFKTWSPLVGQDAINAGIAGIAVHEFGHVLGFMHEQLRVDAVAGGSCTAAALTDLSSDLMKNYYAGVDIGPGAKPQRKTDIQYYGYYDVDSVMNYCNPNWNNNAMLAYFDERGVEANYGKKQDGTISGVGGKCVSLPNASTASGTLLNLWDCWDDGPNQRWTYSPPDGHITSTLTPPGTSKKCVGVYARGGNMASGASLGACDATEPGQAFVLTHSQIRHGDLCLEREADATVTFARCDPATPIAQQWELASDGTIHEPTPTPTVLSPKRAQSCLQGGVGAAHTKICYDTPDQWKVSAGGVLTSTKGSCLGAYGNLALVSACDNGAPEQLTIRGSFKVASLDMCLETTGGLPVNGAALRSAPCDYGRAQRFDYHPTGDYALTPVPPLPPAPTAPTGCTASTANCNGDVSVFCSTYANTQPGDLAVLKRQTASGAFQAVAHGGELVDGTRNAGDIVTWEVCVDRDTQETCSAPISFQTRAPSCGGSGSGGDSSTVSGLTKTCGKPPFKACDTLTAPPHH